MAGIKINDHPMKCCGIVEASNFWHREFPVPATGKEPSEEDYGKQLDEIEGFQKRHRRNCALISLSDQQMTIRRIAEGRGWVKLTEFYNPNSGRQVAIYSKILWPTRTDFKNDTEYEQPTTHAQTRYVFTYDPETQTDTQSPDDPWRV